MDIGLAGGSTGSNPIDTDENKHADTVLSTARILLIANPKAGTTSNRAFQSALASVKRHFSEVGITRIEVCQTQHHRHAVELITERAVHLHEYAAILAMGGDGTLHEVTNGMAMVLSGQADKMRQTGSSSESTSAQPGQTEGNGYTTATSARCPLPPIAPIPAGTGNAVARSINISSIKQAVQNVIHGIQARTSVPMCIMRYSGMSHATNKSESSTEHWVVGGVQWGLPAQVDQGTEWMRFMGEARLTVGALGHICSKRDYRARIKIQVHPDLQREADEEIARLQADFNRKKSASSKQQKPFCNEQGAPARSEHPLCEKTADNEYTLDGKFVMLVAWNCQAISSDFIMTPLGRMSQVDAFDVMLVPSYKMSRVQMIDFMLHSDGSFLGSAAHRIKYFKATKMSVEELEGDFLTVDGEPVQLEPFVLEIAPESGSIHLIDTMTSTT